MRVDLVVLVRLSPEEQNRLAEAGQLSMDQAMHGVGFVEHRLPARSEEAQALMADLESRGAEFYVHEERQFTLREIRDARAICTEPTQRLRMSTLPSKTAFDWTEVCSLCMRSPEQLGHLEIHPRHLADQTALMGSRGELIVNEAVAMRMIKDGITGCLLREIRTPENAPALSETFYQVLVTNTLPPLMSPPTRFVLTDDYCEECAQGGLHLESMLYYDFPDDELDDVNVTAELFGDGSGISAKYVFSPHFYNMLVAAGAELETTEPVIFV